MDARGGPAQPPFDQCRQSGGLGRLIGRSLCAWRREGVRTNGSSNPYVPPTSVVPFNETECRAIPYKRFTNNGTRGWVIFSTSDSASGAFSDPAAFGIKLRRPVLRSAHAEAGNAILVACRNSAARMPCGGLFSRQVLRKSLRIFRCFRCPLILPGLGLNRFVQTKHSMAVLAVWVT